MLPHVLIGIGAGAASALLSVAGAFGPPAAILLVVFAGLPIMIAALGWSHFSALVAIVVAFLGMFAMFNFTVAIALALTVGLPAWWLGYLALLARPTAEAGVLEWYPVGGLVFWAALLGGATVAFALPFYGLDEATLQATLREVITRAVRLRSGGGIDGPLVIPGVSDPEKLVDFFAYVAPFMSAIAGAIVNFVNLWLAAQIVRISGRLRRPWPEIPAMRFPRYAFAFTVATLALSFLPDIFGIFAGVFGIVTLIAYGVLGLAVIHTVTRGTRVRGAILTTTYASLAILIWPILIAMLIGLADSIFDFRARFAAWRGTPPALHP